MFEFIIMTISVLMFAASAIMGSISGNYMMTIVNVILFVGSMIVLYLMQIRNILSDKGSMKHKCNCKNKCE